MSVPKSVIRFKSDSVIVTSEVDRANYTIRELTRAAMRDVGKYVVRLCNMAAQKRQGMKKNRRVRGKTSAFTYWARKRETDLIVGIKHWAWYGVDQELGTSKQPKHGILRNTVYNNIDEIEKIEAQYLSAIEDERKARELINENDYEGGADDD